MPGSKSIGDDDFDDRIALVLRAAFLGWQADIRKTLTASRSLEADHRAESRVGHDELAAVMTIHEHLSANVRPIVVIVDDVLNSGKHFRVAKAKILDRFPGVEVRGVFLARCVREPGDDFRAILGDAPDPK